MSDKVRRILEFFRSLAVTLIALAGAAFFLDFVDQYYPLKEWLFFRYAATWIYSLAFLFSSLSAGWRMCRRLLPSPMPHAERLVLSVSVGVLAFFGGIFLAGCFDLYGTLFFFAWPLLLISYGGPQFILDHMNPRDGTRKPDWRSLLPQTRLQILALALLSLGILAVYLQVMMPMNLGADSYCYHEPIAESYVAAGGIRRFNEGWYAGAYPQLASFLYAWAYQAPGTLFDHILLCMHVEFVLFVATLLGASVFAARLLRRDRLPYAAAAVFLFPKLFIYDSNLNGGADHTLAFFCTALAIAMLRLGRRFKAEEAVFAGLMAGAAIMTKYQAVSAFVPAALLVLFLIIRTRRLTPALVWGSTALACSSPHWLKNWIYYHDPLYPFLHNYLHSTPFHKGAATLLSNVFWVQSFMVSGSTTHKLVTTLEALATFSFLPNDWGFHGKWPEFGSLFTLLLPALLVLRATRRIWITIIGIHLGIAIWYLISHQDRYLQCLVPSMAAVTAAGLALAWARGLLARVSVALLVGVQIIWSTDAYFIPAHAMLGESPIRSLTSYLSAGYRREYEPRYHFGASAEDFGKRLPKGAKILLHLYNTHLGLGAEFTNDAAGWQGGIEYLETDSPKNTANLLRSYGVTHIAWASNQTGMAPSEVAREIVFTRMIHEYIHKDEPVNNWKLGVMNDKARQDASAQSRTKIAWLTCDASPALGIYTPQGLSEGHAERILSSALSNSELARELTAANAVVMRATCSTAVRAQDYVNTAFAKEQRASEFDLWIRTSWSDAKN